VTQNTHRTVGDVAANHVANNFIDSFSKTLALAVALLYILGFVVVAGHLTRYGVSTFAVFQIEYLAAGTWVAAPLAMGFAVLRSGQKFSARVFPETPRSWNWRGFLFEALVGGLPYVGFVALLVSIPGLVENLTWAIGVRLLLFFVGVVNSAELFWRSWRSAPGRETRLINRSHAAPFYFTLTVVLLFGYAVWFSARIYPVIPYSLGGGRPLIVAFVSGQTGLPKVLLHDNSSGTSAPYKLLTETDKDYIVLSPNAAQESIQISRDSVQGVVILRDPGDQR
jgi:hypothetical protein